MYYHLGPWPWSAAGPVPGWAPPPSTVGALDLATLEDHATPGQPRPLGFFATTERLDSTYALLGTGDLRELPSTGLMRDTLASCTGYRPRGATLLALVVDLLCAGADPTGQDRWKPLMPTHRRELEVHLGGHGRVHRERFAWGPHVHTNQVQAVLHADMQARYAAVEAGHLPLAQLQRMLDYDCHKYRVDDWRTLVPGHLHHALPGRLPHATVITDTFDRANSSSLGTGGEGWSWTEVTGDLKIISNKLGCDTSGYARAESDLSGSDMYATGVLDPAAFQYSTLECRCASAADTDYRGFTGIENTPNYKCYLSKRVTGSQTNLTSVELGSGIGAVTAKVTCSGSTLTYYYNDATVQRLQTTDTAITGNTRAGAGATPGSTTDTWEAGDGDGIAAGQPTLRRFGLTRYGAWQSGKPGVTVF